MLRSFDHQYSEWFDSVTSPEDKHEIGREISETSDLLAFRWIECRTNTERESLKETYGIEPISMRNSLRPMAEAALSEDPSVPFGGLTESGDLCFAIGFPPRLISPEKLIAEKLEYQVNAQKEDGNEEVSCWYKDPDTAWGIKKEIEETETYENVTVMKRLTSMKNEEDDEGHSEATLEMKTKSYKKESDSYRKGPSGKGKSLGTRVHKDKKKEKNKKAARGKQQKNQND